MRTCNTGSIVLRSHFNRTLLCCVTGSCTVCVCVQYVCARAYITVPPVWFAVPCNATEGSVTILSRYRGQIRGQMKYQQDHMTTDYHEGFNRTEGPSSTALCMHGQYTCLFLNATVVCVSTRARTWDSVTE